MNVPSPNLLTQLADINGLDRISWWPLASGWWMVLALTALLVVSGIFVYLRQLSYERSWKCDAKKTLISLESILEENKSQDVAAALSAVLRRIAIKKFSRTECAGLEGSGWLLWLKKNDPRGFDWLDQGTLLIEAPYVPPGSIWPPEQIKTLINATKEWVR